MTTTARERFEALVDRSGGPESCHLWLGQIDPKGYARFVGPFSHNSAARNALGFAGRAPAPGKHSRHTCDVRACVNDRHLVGGTAAQNKADAVERGRHAHGERHPRARLTDADVRWIKATFTGRRGELAAMARQLGVGSTAVERVVHGKRWTHVQPTDTPVMSTGRGPNNTIGV